MTDLKKNIILGKSVFHNNDSVKKLISGLADEFLWQINCLSGNFV